MVRSSVAVGALVVVGCVGSSSGEPCGTVRSQLAACPGSTLVHGIDVSDYQGSIDWTRAASAGVGFAFGRVSDGTDVIDGEFAHNWRAMQRAGVLRGAYQFFRAAEDATAQATLMVEILDGAGGLESTDLGVAIDIETADGQAAETVTSQVGSWIAVIERLTGRTPIVYTNAATSAVLGTTFASYPLWVANWGVPCPTMPEGWTAWRYWQTSNAGSVPGIQAPVDLDEFDGTLQELLAATTDAGLDGGPANAQAGSEERGCESEL
ncbi:MAG: GH25 family lysozyme [Polyangiaceae bacterium]|jgi:lysozyme